MNIMEDNEHLDTLVEKLPKGLIFVGKGAAIDDIGQVRPVAKTLDVIISGGITNGGTS